MAAVLCTTFVAGCYTFVPSDGSMLVQGKPIALDINDLGRINLTGLIGGDVRRLSGLLVEHNSSGYIVRVDQLTYLNGRTAEWSGEPLNVRQDYISSSYESKLSTSKTALAVLAGAGAVGALLAARSLVGGGNGNDPVKPSSPNPPTSSRGGN